jgi:hypothetical protein
MGRVVLLISATFCLPIEVPANVQVAEIESAYRRLWCGLVAETLEPWSEPLSDLGEQDITLDLEGLSGWDSTCLALQSGGWQP